MLNIKIKASQVNNLTDARYFAALGVDYLGFNLDLSHDERLSPELFHAIKEWVEGPKVVAEINKTPLDLLLELYNEKDFDLVQSLNPIDNQDNLIKITPHSLEDLNALLPSEIYVLDFSNIDETHLYESADQLASICNRLNLIIPLPVDEKYHDVLIQKIKPYGIEVKGGMEEKVGFKSFDELDAFFEKMQVQ